MSEMYGIASDRAERWKAVVGFEGLYEVSDLGRVRSLDRVIVDKNGRRVNLRGKVLRPGPRPSGHLTVVIVGDSYNVHTLVLEAFVGPRPDPNWEGRHGDGNEQNNHLSNLSWSTRSQNRIDRKWHKGARHYVLTPETAAELKFLLKAKAMSRRLLAKTYGVSKSTVDAIGEGRFHNDV